MNETDDIQLLRATRLGDANAFQSLYRRHRSRLYGYALLHCGAPEVAADVVQEVFIGLLNDDYRFDPLKGMLSSFLYGVTHNLLLRHARQNERWVQPDPDVEDGEHGDGATGLASAAGGAGDIGENGPLHALLDQEAADHLRRALARLAPHYRDVLILFELQELSYQEIAGICQLDIGTVRSRLSRGRSALYKALAPYRAIHQNLA
ncbi:RNA polymerase sigma factor [Oxalobacteraceae bacterium A2-2]